MKKSSVGICRVPHKIISLHENLTDLSKSILPNDQSENKLPPHLEEIARNLPKIRHTYCGHLDENGFRSGIGCEQWSSEDSRQKYSGNFLYNNFHSYGIYLIEDDNPTYFEGLFYANRLEGYGQVIYSDCRIFEGLFRRHYRFGPGVVTNPDNTQDVGLWDGFSLMRLSSTVSPDCVPRLGRTPQGKSKLLKFRKFVPICPKRGDVAKEVLTGLGADEEVMDQSDLLYNLQVRNPDSLFFNRKLYDESFFTEEDCTIEVELTKEEFEAECSQAPEEQSCLNSEDESSDTMTQNSVCSCFNTNRDKFTRICIQLHNIELKLEKLEVDKHQLMKEIKHCKHCCSKRQQEAAEKEARNKSTETTHGEPPKKIKAIENVIEDKITTEGKLEEGENLEEDGENLEEWGELVKDEENTNEEETLSGDELVGKQESKENVEEDVSNKTETTPETHEQSFDISEREVTSYIFPSGTSLLSGASLPFSTSKSSRLTLPFYSHSPGAPDQNQMNNEKELEAEKQLDEEARETSRVSSMISISHKATQEIVSIARYSLIEMEPSSVSETTLDEENWESIEHVCICDHLDIKSADLLQKKLDRLKMFEEFYKIIVSNLKEKLDAEYLKVHELSQEEPKYIKRVVVSDLLAWNNENIAVKMLQHCFLHRGSENNVKYKVSALLAGDRKAFKSPGTYEKSCRQFLEACCNGNERAAFNLLRTHNINPDICDARGNTGMMFAASRDKLSVISILVNCGGKVDALNDEGLTPLALSLLQYITLKFKVSDWEKGFLKDIKLNEEDLLEIQQWRPHQSLLSLITEQTSIVFEKDISQQIAKHADFSTKLSFTDVFKNSPATLPSEDRMLEVKERLAAIELNSKSRMSTISIERKKIEQEYVLNTGFTRIPVVKLEKKKKEKGKKKKDNKKDKKKKEKEKDKKKDKKKDNKKDKNKKSGDEERKKSDKGSRSGSLYSTDSVKSSKREQSSGQKSDEEIKRTRTKELNALKQEYVKKTVTTLLGYGADPNIGEVPMQPLFLSIFTGDPDLVKGLLDNKADPNVTTREENLTGLHVVASLKPTEQNVAICKILLAYNVDPNRRTSTNHWSEIKNEIIGEGLNEIDIEDTGKNVLHLLCAREDYNYDPFNYLGEMADILVKSGCSTTDFYLGHTPLSLAVLRGNIKLIDNLLETQQVDPHQVLGNGMGNVMTVLILRRFSSLPDEKNKEIINLLVKHRMNPLNRVGSFENTIHFLENERGVTDKPAKGKKTKKLKKTESRKSLEATEKYLEATARKILFKHIQGKAVGCLYTFITENLYDDPLIVSLSSLVSAQEALECLKLIFQYGRLKQDTFSHVVATDVIKFITLQRSPDELFRDDDEEIVLKIRNTPFLDLKAETRFPLPEIDKDTKKYRVCFQCLQHREKLLLYCPQCELVYFCSEECNILNNQTCSYHRCRSIFYKEEELLFQENGKQRNKLNELITMTKKIREARIALSQWTEMQEKMAKVKFKTVAMRKKAEEMMKKEELLRLAREDYAKAKGLMEYSCEDLPSRNKLTSKQAQKERRKSPLSENESCTPFISEEPETHKQEQRKVFVPKHKQKSRFHKPEDNLWQKSAGEKFNTTSKTSPLNLPKGKHAKPMMTTIEKNLKKSVVFSKFKSKQDLEEKTMREHLEGIAGRYQSQRKYTEDFNIEFLRYTPKKSVGDAEEVSSMQKRDGQSMIADNFMQIEGQPEQAQPIQQDQEQSHINREYFMNLLSKAFADFNLNLFLLPYSCYKDGQIYYSMHGNTHFGKMFQRLDIPD